MTDVSFQDPIGKAMPRAGTRRLVAGRGRYTDDVTLKGELYAAFLRSSHPHAMFSIGDTTRAKAIDGVVAVLTASDLDGICKSWRTTSLTAPGMASPEQLALARDEAVYQGEPVALVLAHSRAAAEDALEHIEVAWKPLPAVATMAAALGDRARVREKLSTNLCWESRLEKIDSGAPAPAALTVHAKLSLARKTGVPLETRGILASFDPSVGSLLVYVSHQMPHQLQLHLADLLDLSVTKVDVVCGDVGGGFGIKMHIYPEEVAVCAASKLLGRPIKFIADRIESLLSDVHAREHDIEGRMQVDADGRIISFEIDDTQGLGAYSVYPRSSTVEGLSVLRAVGGPYRFANYRARLRSVLQNKAMTGQYRSVGHPVAVLITERLIELAAKQRNEDAIEFRRRNFVAAEEMPWISPTGARMIDLSHHACLDKLLTLIDHQRLITEIKAKRAQNRLVGLGIACFVEFTATGSEGYGPAGVPVASVDTVVTSLSPTGEVRVLCPAAEVGQGIQQGIAQVVAGGLGIDVEKVRVLTGDTATIPHGGGAWSSRGAAITGEAAWGAARQLRSELLKVAAALLQTSSDVLDIRRGHVVDAQSGKPRIDLAEIGRIATFEPYLLPKGSAPQLTTVHQWGRGSDPFLPTNGVQACLVEIDADTGIVHVVRHWVVHDCGRIINPLLVVEQVRGGVMQGLGEALLEACRYDDAGQFISGTLADYLLPMAVEAPDIVVAHVETPYSGTEMGAKGCGEAGACGAPAAVLNAVNDALGPLNAAVHELPITPVHILRALGKIKDMS